MSMYPYGFPPMAGFPAPAAPLPMAGGAQPGGAQPGGAQPGGTAGGQNRPQLPPLAPLEESYIENILRMNRGKIATIYTTYENNPKWPALTYRGRVEAAGHDHVILSDPETGKRYLLLMVNIDYITFDEPLEYLPPPVPGYVRY